MKLSKIFLIVSIPFIISGLLYTYSIHKTSILGFGLICLGMIFIGLWLTFDMKEFGDELIKHYGGKNEN
jgi:hypothetical protein